MIRACRKFCWLLASFTAVVGCAVAAQPLTVPTGAPVYSAPMATIKGHGAVPFHVTFGMLVNRQGDPVGLYRSYPSDSAVPMSEQYGLGMLGTTAGVILASYRDIPLLVLHGHIAGKPGSYLLSLAYLAHVAPRRYGRCTLRIARTPRGQWEMLDPAGRRITVLVVVSSPSGIAGISGCQAG